MGGEQDRVTGTGSESFLFHSKILQLNVFFYKIYFGGAGGWEKFIVFERKKSYVWILGKG